MSFGPVHMTAEQERLEALRGFGILDTPPEERLDRLTRMAADVFGTPIALVSLIDEHRQWFKSRLGLDVAETPREWSFCDHLIRSGDSSLVVQDATTDARFSANPLVTEPPKIRFYAGVPLLTSSGHALGALCVVDTMPRDKPKSRDMDMLIALGAMASDALETSRRRELSDEHEALLELGGALSGLGHWRYEIATDRLTWSERLAAMHGFAPQAGKVMTMEAMQHLYVAEDRHILGLHLELARTGGQDFTLALRRLRADGSIGHFTCKAACRRDKAGRVAALVGVMQDVTAAHEAALKLAESESQLRLFAEHSRDVLCHVGSDGRRLYVSPACGQMFGLSPEEMLQTDLLDGIHPDDRGDVARLQLQLLGGSAAEGSVTYRWLSPQTGPICVEFCAHALRAPETGAPNGYVTLLRDISEREEAAEKLRSGQEYLLRAHAEMERVSSHLAKARDMAQSATRAKSRLLASMRHELRTPLNGILGYAQLLKQTAILDIQERGWLQTMLDAGDHLLATIANVQDPSEMEARVPDLHPEDVGLENLLDQTVNLLRPEADRRGLRLSAVFSPEAPHEIRIDATRLRQILLNLIENAVIYTRRGSVWLRVSSGSPGRLRFEVEDTGPGIAAAQRSTLFGNADPAATEQNGGELNGGKLNGGEQDGGEQDRGRHGAGLGLPICARLTGALGGTIGHEDATGGGSVFWLDVPYARVTERNDATDSATGAATFTTFIAPPAHVLVVGEAAMNRDIIGAFLQSAGHHVSSASSGTEALALAAAETFQVVLMDMHMSGMDGPETTRRLRAMHGINGRVPVIAMMQLPTPADIERYRNAGMDMHLPKPFSCPQLLDAVTSALNLRHMQPHRHAELLAGPAAAAECDTDAPVCDTEMFDRTASFLSREDVRKHVKTLAARSEEILGQLRGPANSNIGQDDLLAAAHSVAGSAGMFGFQRLSQSARRYELAVVRDLPEREPATRGLVAAIETTLRDMEMRLAS
jgi:PAS domain S-box-containing protein